MLKIDGTFIRNLDTSLKNQLFVESMVHVARGLGKRTVAEFVENRNTLEMLKQLGVDMAQGYYLDTPKKQHPAITAIPCAEGNAYADAVGVRY